MECFSISKSQEETSQLTDSRECLPVTCGIPYTSAFYKNPTQHTRAGAVATVWKANKILRSLVVEWCKSTVKFIGKNKQKTTESQNKLEDILTALCCVQSSTQCLYMAHSLKLDQKTQVKNRQFSNIFPGTFHSLSKDTLCCITSLGINFSFHDVCEGKEGKQWFPVQ